MTTVFLSGSRQLSRLNPQVRERIGNIVAQGFRVVVGDANGADKAMQAYLCDIAYPHVVVYCSGGKCRNNLGLWHVEEVCVPPHIKGREFYTFKDRAMADEADFGFVIWDGKSAGALENVVELLKQSKKVLLFLSPASEFYTIASVGDLQSVLGRCGADEIAIIDSKIGLSRSLRILQGKAQVALGI
jgi:hypothetical protein